MTTRKAWTGGKLPKAWRDTPADERTVARSFARQDWLAYREYWGTIALESARVLWKRARYDALATLGRN